jgi:hypothetical protein
MFPITVVIWIINNIPVAIIRKETDRLNKNTKFCFYEYSYAQPQAYPQYDGGFNPLLQQSGPVTTTQVTIPTELAGKS